MELPPLIQAMTHPSFYPHRPQEVGLAQTHASWIFFAGKQVWKVKKPVDFGFLDYSTLARRAWYCRREIALNRRLARGLYRAAVPLREENGLFHPGGRGRVVDYAVVMARIPDRGLLSHHLEDGRVTPPMMRELARHLESFHRQSAAGPRVARHATPAALSRNQEENFEQTLPFVGKAVSRHDFALIGAYARSFLAARTGLLRRRIREGRIREGHGDLHAEHIGWRHGRSFAFDCIEFAPRFRCADVAAEVAFLAMDLEERGAWPLARAFLDEYLEASGDEEIRPLLDYYLCYRAFVRGKVNGLASVDPREGRAERTRARAAAARYFRLAAAYARRDRRPLLVVMSGLTGTGKSTLAGLLAGRLGFAVLSSDVMRKRLAGIRSGRHFELAWGSGLYSPEMTARTYRALLTEGARLLAAGSPVVLDATFIRRKDREDARRLAEEAGARHRLVETVCREELVRRRLRERWGRQGAISDGRWEIYRAQLAALEAPAAATGENPWRLDTGGRGERVWRRLLRGLYPLAPVGEVP